MKRVATWISPLALLIALLFSVAAQQGEKKPGSKFMAGAVVVDVTPQKFPVIVNGGMTSRQATKVTTPLKARALALADGKEKLVIVVVDSCMMPRPLIDEAKKIASEQIGLSTDRILVSATHTHTAGSCMGALGTPPDPDYTPFLRSKLVEAITLSLEKLQPAKVGFGRTEAAEYTAVRRWIRRPDRLGKDPFGNPTVRANMHAGKVPDDVTGESGPEDPELSFISFQTAEGKPLALLANFSMHYFAGEREISADYFGLYCEGLKERLAPDSNFVPMMSHGCSGDIWRRDYNQPAKKWDIQTYADGLVEKTVEALKGIDHRESPDLAMAESRMTLNYRVPNLQLLEWSKKVVEKMGDRLPKTKEEIYAKEQIILHERQQTEVVTQAIRIGDMGIATTPNETYAITGLKIKTASPLKKTMVIELANGGDGYIPPPEQHLFGGYNTWAARSAGLEVMAEPKIMESCINLLEEVAGSPRRLSHFGKGTASEAIEKLKPIAWYRLNEHSGPRALDATGNHRDGIFEPQVTYFLEGPHSNDFCDDSQTNRAPMFVGGRIQTHHPDLKDNWAISLWLWNGMPKEGRDVSGWFVSRGNNHGLGRHSIHLGVGGKSGHSGKLILQSGTNPPVAGLAQIPRWQWQHVVFNRSGENISVYLNGEEEIKSKAPPGFFETLFLGGRSDNSSNWEGRLDEVAIFNRTLTNKEINSLRIKPKLTRKLRLLDQYRISEEAPEGVLTQHQLDEGHLVFDYQWGEHTWGFRAELSRMVELRFGDRHTFHLKEGEGIKGARIPALNPVGEWNRFEAIVNRNQLQIIQNGKTAGTWEISESKHNRLEIVARGAAIEIRNLEIWPLGQYQEKWTPESRSTDTGRSEAGESILPRREPWPPEKSRQAWKIDGDFELQLVAAEPLVCDPVDVAWDERGRMFVAEIRDYPFPPKQGKRLSRIRLLSDTDRDGKMDQSETWADNLPDVQGLLPMNGGIFITTSKGLWFLEDTTGDNRADRTTPILVTNAPRHSQLQLASPRYLLDNTIHLNNGIDGKEIHPAGQPDQILRYKGFNLNFHPKTGALKKSPGIGQFGAATDDYGRLFFCSNRNPVMHRVLPQFVVDRNRFAGIRSGHEDIQPSAARVFPLELSHTTAAAHAGTHTSACGLAVYRGNLMPELKGHLLVCDPTAQLITRNRIEPKGSSFAANRIGENRDFLVSGDEWSRPVNLRNGPDGALYICDMYRRFIDHEVYFPDAFAKSNYMRAGFDHGRIWRLVKKGQKPTVPSPLSEDLVAELESDIPWRRTTAQINLVAAGDKDRIPKLESLYRTTESIPARIHALWTIHGIAGESPLFTEALKDSSPEVVENALQILQRQTVQGTVTDLTGYNHASPRVRMIHTALFGQSLESNVLVDRLISDGDDPWLRKAIMSLSPSSPAIILVDWLKRNEKPVNRTLVKEFSQAVSARGNTSEISAILQAIDDQPDWVVNATVAGMNTGLRQGPQKSLDQVLRNPTFKLDRVREVLRSAREVAQNDERSLDDRLAALALVQEERFTLVEELIKPHQPPAIQEAACRILSAENRDQTTDFFFKHWDSLGPGAQREAIALMIRSTNTTKRLMEKMKSGAIPASAMPPMNRWVLSRSKNQEIKTLANHLFGKTESNRSGIIADYKSQLTVGDPERGRAVFIKATCASCHEGETKVGPQLTGIRNKPLEALLSDILNPNRAVEERWKVYQVETLEGENYIGILAEGTDYVEVSQVGGISRRIPRSKIKTLKASGQSLMPEGLEAVISKQEMSDLLAYLKK